MVDNSDAAAADIEAGDVTTTGSSPRAPRRVTIGRLIRVWDASSEPMTIASLQSRADHPAPHRAHERGIVHHSNGPQPKRRYGSSTAALVSGARGSYGSDTVAKVESCRATDFSRNYETGTNRRFV
jgi:hypothetical protein